MTAKIIVGLGNPGKRYEKTRHNVGFMALDAVAGKHHGGPWKHEAQSLVCECEVSGQSVLLAKPLTFMNLCGRAVSLLIEKRALDINDLLVILDDLNLPFGRVRVRPRGSSGGHRGLESVLRVLGSDEIVRLRLGIGEEDTPDDQAEFVLSEFPPHRERELNEMLSGTREAIETILSNGISKTMTVYNA